MKSTIAGLAVDGLFFDFDLDIADVFLFCFYFVFAIDCMFSMYFYIRNHVLFNTI